MEDVGRRRALRAWLPVFAWAAAILLLSARPADALPRSWFLFEDKLVHAAIYLGLGALAGRAVRLSELGSTGLVLGLVAVCAFGLIDEWTQRFSPGRTPDLADWLADAVGAACGLLLVVRYHRRRTRKRRTRGA